MSAGVSNKAAAAVITRELSWEQWLVEYETLRAWRESGTGNRITVVVTTELAIDHPQLETLNAVDTVVIEIKSFTDGRVFGLARLIRKKVGFEGVLQASGDYLPDQISFMKRVGFDSFSDSDCADTVTNYYSGFYQPDVDEAHISIRTAHIDKRV